MPRDKKGQTGGTGATGSTGATGLIDNPYGALPTYSNSNPATISWNSTEDAMSLRSSSDTHDCAAFPAFRVNLASSETHKLSIKIKSNTTASSGVYIRVYEYNSALPAGKTAVSHSASYGQVQEDTSGKTNWFENGSVNTSWATKEYTYTPTSGAQWASIVILNWSGLGTNYLYIRDPMHQLIGSSGATGSTGSTGAKGQKGQTGNTGGTGGTGGTGAKGQKGAAGTNGTNGSNGSNGAKGQKVRKVKLVEQVEQVAQEPKVKRVKQEAQVVQVVPVLKVRKDKLVVQVVLAQQVLKVKRVKQEAQVVLVQQGPPGRMVEHTIM